ncbi:MAG: FAD-dependent monooxygenase [Natronospirillum sp.]
MTQRSRSKSTPNAKSKADADTDILIVGGGMIGAALCLGLKNLPWRVTIADGRIPDDIPVPGLAHDSDFDQRVSALSLGSEHWLKALGAWQTMHPSRLGRYDQMQVWDADGGDAVTLSRDDAQLDHLGHIIENRTIERALWHQLSQWPELNRQLGQPVVDAQYDENRQWRVRFADHSTLCTRLLLIADGAMSPLRSALGFKTREWDYLHHAVVATVTHEKTHQRVARQAFHRHGPLAFLPLATEHTSSIVWSLVPEEAERFIQATPEQQAIALTRGLRDELGAVTMASSVRSFPLYQRHATHYILPGAALVGDAAHSIHPLAGQGANIGLLDAQAMVDELTHAATHHIPLEETLLLRRYQRRRKVDNLLTMAGMEGLQHLFAADHHAIHWLRNRGMHWFNQQPLLRRAAVELASRLAD